MSLNPYPKLYEILGCPVDSSQTTIREQYRILSLRHHPDRGGRTSKMSKINGAFEILSDPDKKKIYDTIGTDFYINDINNYLKVPRVIYNYLPIFINARIDRLLNIKDLIINYSINKNLNKVENNLGYFHIIGFPLVHHFVESNLSKYLNSRIQDNENNVDNGIFNKSFRNNLLSESIATIIAAPFEIIAYRAFKEQYQISELSKLFIFGNVGNNASSVNPILKILQIVPNIKEYFKMYKTSFKYVLGMVVFRILFNLTFVVIKGCSDYLQHKYLEANHQIEEIEKYNSILHRDLQELKKLKRNASFFKFFSIASNVASYGLPCCLFSIHRFFYHLDNPTTNNYFSVALIKAGLSEAFSMFGFELVTMYYRSSIDNSINLLKYIGQAIYGSVTSTNNNNTNNNNDTN